MFGNTPAFSGFAVDDLDAARTFYGETLGLNVTDGPMGILTLQLAGDRPTMIYPKADFTPATYTILNFPVEDVDAAVDELTARGVEIRALRRLRPGREGHHARQRPDDRLVHGPGGQHPRRARSRLAASFSTARGISGACAGDAEAAEALT